MAPAKDLAWSEDAMDQTFYFMNVCPQDETLNAKDWNYLEKQVRRWAREYGKVWVVSGSLYSAIGFVMGNDSERYFLADCAMSVNDLEALTGIDFFPSLPDDIEDLVESDYDLSVWDIKSH